jgi:hypothetical protein
MCKRVGLRAIVHLVNFAESDGPSDDDQNDGDQDGRPLIGAREDSTQLAEPPTYRVLATAMRPFGRSPI